MDGVSGDVRSGRVEEREVENSAGSDQNSITQSNRAADRHDRTGQEEQARACKPSEPATAAQNTAPTPTCNITLTAPSSCCQHQRFIHLHHHQSASTANHTSLRQRLTAYHIHPSHLLLTLSPLQLSSPPLLSPPLPLHSSLLVQHSLCLAVDLLLPHPANRG